MLPIHILTHILYKSWLVEMSALIIFPAELIDCCSLVLTCFVGESNHAVMDEQNTDWNDGSVEDDQQLL